MPEINTAMARKIADRITAHPDTHNQDYWSNECGTTRCIAGWAVYLQAVDSARIGDGQEVGEVGLNGLARDYLRAEGLEEERFYVPVETAGRHILGLTVDQAEKLFWTTSNPLAVEYVAELATGSIPAELLED